MVSKLKLLDFQTHVDFFGTRGQLICPVVIRAAWDLKVQRLEEFSARYLAFRLEEYIDEAEFEELIRESASRIRNRQETDTIELLDEWVSPGIKPLSY